MKKGRQRCYKRYWLLWAMLIVQIFPTLCSRPLVTIQGRIGYGMDSYPYGMWSWKNVEKSIGTSKGRGRASTCVAIVAMQQPLYRYLKRTAALPRKLKTSTALFVWLKHSWGAFGCLASFICMVHVLFCSEGKSNKFGLSLVGHQCSGGPLVVSHHSYESSCRNDQPRTIWKWNIELTWVWTAGYGWSFEGELWGCLPGNQQWSDCWCSTSPWLGSPLPFTRIHIWGLNVRNTFTCRFGGKHH